jgi:hypothetical protein
LIIPNNITVTLNAADITLDFSIKVESGGQLLIDENCTINGNLNFESNNKNSLELVTGDESITFNGGNKSFYLSSFEAFTDAILAMNALGKSLIIDQPVDLGGATIDCLGVGLVWLSKGNLVSNGDLSNFKIDSAGMYELFDSTLTFSGKIYANDILPQWFGNVNNIENDAAQTFQRLADLSDLDKFRSIYIPFNFGDYNIESVIAFEEPGIYIYGNSGPTYQRGIGRGNNLIAAAGLETVFDLGNYRTEGNPADHWTIEGLSFVAAPLGGRNTKCLSFTSQTNGPDRNAHIRNCSAQDLYALAYVAPPNLDVTHMLANLNIENSNLSNCEYAVKADGNCLGLRFVNNQAEQNVAGCIHGAFVTGVTIEDNMLEGTPNCINIDATTISGMSYLRISIQRNYFEANSGDYIINLVGQAFTCAAKIGQNQISVPDGTDYLRLVGGTWQIEIEDPFPATLVGSTIILPTSRLFARGIDYYYVRGITDTVTNEVLSHDFMHLAGKTLPLNSTINTTVGSDTAVTPFGTTTSAYSFSGGSGYINNSDLSYSAGDVISISFLMLVDYNGINNTLIHLRDVDYNLISTIPDPVIIEQGFSKGWTLATFTTKLTGATATLRISFYNASGTPADVTIAGYAISNHGQDIGEPIAITPILPV